MSKRKYGVLRGGIDDTAMERDNEKSPHYQIKLMADGQPWRIAVNVKSTAGDGNESYVLYCIVDDFSHPMLETVKGFKEGFSPLKADSEAGGFDYVRGNLFDPKDLRLLPPHLPGEGNDLNDVIDAHMQRAKNDRDAVLFAFGIPWGPEKKPDKTFSFTPNRGIHDIHMNQGNPLDGGHSVDNGVWQDGGLLLWFPKADRWVAFFLAFQGQSWHTDDRTGHPLEGQTGAEPARFDGKYQPLPDAEQTQAAVEIVAVRVRKSGRMPQAVLLLNVTEQDMCLDNWSLETTEGNGAALSGDLPAGEPVTFEVPSGLFVKKGGQLTLLDGSGLKVDGTTYPPPGPARSGWIRTA